VSDLKHQLEALRLAEQEARPSRRRWLLAGAALVILAALLIAWRTVASGPVEVETVRASIQEARPSGGSPMLTASGYVVARRKAVVSAKIQGRLAVLRAEEGTRVREGDVIARLESTDYEAQVARSRARVTAVQSQVASAESRIARADADLAEARRQQRLAERLLAEGVGTMDARDAANSRVAIAEAALAQATADRSQVNADLAQAQADVSYAEALLANTVIKAPFAGVVVKKMAEVGESVAPIPPGVNISTSSGAIVALADLDTLEVEVDVSESSVSKLGDQQPAEVVVEAFPDRTYHAVLRQVIPTADRTKATVMVKVTLLDKDQLLKPEMSAKVTFLERAAPAGSGPAKPIVMVPQEAVVTRDGGTFVYEVTAGGTVRVRQVSAASTVQGRVVIKDGLSGSETLVTRPPETLKDGDPVRVPPGGAR
jgi:RND family efflux transporter MFP subunit